MIGVRKIRGSRASRRGFTLVEIMMALTIMLVGVVGVFAVFSVGLVNHKRAVDYTVAANLAASLFDDIAANYEVLYYDGNGNGTPDLAEDRNNNNMPDWFEPDSTGNQRYPIPYRRGYRYTVRYERHPEVPQALLVSARIYWMQAGQERGEDFQRSIFIKDLAEIEQQP